MIYICPNSKCQQIWSTVSTIRKVKGKKEEKNKPPTYFAAPGICPDCAYK